MTSYDSLRVLVIFLAVMMLLPAVAHSSSFSLSFADEEGTNSDATDGSGEHDESEEYEEESDYYGEDSDGIEYAEHSYEEESASEESAYAETIYDDAVFIEEEEIVTVNVLGNDRALIGWEKPLKLESVSEAHFGQLVLNHDSTVTYTPFQVGLPEGYERQERFRYTASIDGNSHYNGTVTIWVRQTNDVPVAFPAEYEVSEDDQITFPLEAFDEDNDSLTFEIISNVTFGQMVVDLWTGAVSYTPASKFSGEDTLTYVVSDGVSWSEVATVRINVLETGGESQVFDNQEDDSIEDTPSNFTDDNTQPISSVGSDMIVLEGDQVIPHVDGSPRVCELVRYYLEDVTVKGAWTGPAALQLCPHALAPVAELPVLEVLGAKHLVADLTLGLGTVVHDYLG